MLQLYGSHRKESNQGVLGGSFQSRERSNTVRSASLVTGNAGVVDGLESMGFQVGCQLGERYSKNKARFEDTLDIVKFLCKDFWTEVFKKQIDNLKTNHRGVFVLYDS